MAITRRTFGALAGAAGASALVRPARAGTITAHGVSAFGDLRYPADFPHFDYVEPTAPKGGMFSSRGTGATGTFDSLNPFILKGTPAQGMEFTLDTLLTPSGDEPDAAYGLLAEAIEYPEDRTWARFFLRPEARFSDGTQVTADDIVFTFQALRDRGDPRYRVIYRDILLAEAEDTHTVRFEFSQDAPTRDMPMLAGNLPALSRAYYAEREFEASTLEPPLGSGPYRVEEADPGRQITFARRADYWARDLPVNVGRWNFDRIRYRYFRDNTAAFEALKSGAYRFHEEFFSKIWATGYDFPAVQSGAVKREVLPDARTAGTQGWFFNLRRDKFADPRVRAAIGLAFDFEWSNRTLFYDLYTRTDSFFEGGQMQADGAPDPAERRYLEPLADILPEGVLDGPAFVPPQSDGSGRNRRPLRRAVKLLDEAGWTVGPNGMRQNAAGVPLEIEILGNSPAFQRIVTPFTKNLEKIGIPAQFRQVDRAQYEERIKKFEFDVTGRRYVMQATPGTELRAIFHSDAADLENSRNLMGLKHPAVDALLEQVSAARTRDELTVVVKALDRVLRALHIWVPNWTKASHTIAYWDVFGRPATKPPFQRGVIDMWWQDADKFAALEDRIQD